MKLEINNIHKSFGEKQVLKGAGFTFEQGKIYGLLGRNGAGKTTLFNCLSGELELDQGSKLLINDKRENGNDNHSEKLAPDDIGYVFSTPILPEFLTGYEFLKFFIDINKDKVSIDKTIDDYFDMVKLEASDKHRLIKGYSHGMKNKLQMLCFMISKPPVILLDEPLTSFDVVVALEMKKLLREMKETHIIIFSTHILQLASDLCDEIVVLSKGRLQKVDHELLHSRDFEDRIIEMLGDEGESQESGGQGKEVQ
ncbi:ATP-binding cassette domain-containing protein [Sinanaerobacter chloroacetimidivorans]|jgi:ABC-2 type transport system ATP-binding protein|uniref:ABC transporter ATP-binding protein n=1 Tax=Sinanaerobacter chloroacetimidivorans TaxID=2818044 RepID=A0A8J8B2B4_9FIRM|nr:ABC transporter ATP-binding protein [Sinanaerobacter chloroacetimidivorans]MBR0597085.1 ABC transporter ATP-binding protein [Sinanaerobacter chloroacetimidivorans]